MFREKIIKLQTPKMWSKFVCINKTGFSGQSHSYVRVYGSMFTKINFTGFSHTYILGYALTEQCKLCR